LPDRPDVADIERARHGGERNPAHRKRRARSPIER